MLRSLPWDSTFDSPGLSSQAVRVLVLWLEVLYITDPHLREILFWSWVLEQECCSHIHPYSALFPCMYQPQSSMEAMNLHCWHCTAYSWLSSGSVPSQDDVCPAVVMCFVPDCEVVVVWWSSRRPLALHSWSRSSSVCVGPCFKFHSLLQRCGKYFAMLPLVRMVVRRCFLPILYFNYIIIRQL